MSINPQLHYLDHVQNTSIGKHCVRFSKAQRFYQPKPVPTQFNYNLQSKKNSKSCAFGLQKRSKLQKIMISPSPDQYNLRAFPRGKRKISMGQGRQIVTFGTIQKQIMIKASMPAPNVYRLPSSLKISKKFSLGKRLKTDIDLIAQKRVPGPGEYDPISLNQQGKYPQSKHHNARCIIMDSDRNDPLQLISLIGPGQYDLFNSDSRYSEAKIQKMRKTTTKIFGTSVRNGPEEKHRMFVPGPGMYQTFSTFGSNFYRPKRSKTEF